MAELVGIYADTSPAMGAVDLSGASVPLELGTATVTLLGAFPALGARATSELSTVLPQAEKTTYPNAT